MSRLTLLACSSALLTAGPAMAATDFGGSIGVHAGYGSNPFLTSPSRGGSGLAGATLSAAVTDREALSTTVLSGIASLEQNFTKYGGNENYIASLTRTQTLSERLTANAGISYQNTVNSSQLNGFDQTNLDVLTIGQRTESFSGNLGAQWMPTARDQLTASGYASRLRYKSFNGDYDSYGGSLGYLHTLSARTKVGFDVNANHVQSQGFGDSSSIGLNGALIQQLNSIWLLNAHVGVFLPRGQLGGGNVSLGFNVSLCGTYPRYSLCFVGSRQTAPSGIGGLRTNLQAGVTLAYDLDSLSKVSASANYTVSDSGRSFLLPKQKFYQGSVSYSHTLSERMSIGATARYQRRAYGSQFGGSAGGYAVTIDVTRRFGRS